MPVAMGLTVRSSMTVVARHRILPRGIALVVAGLGSTLDLHGCQVTVERALDAVLVCRWAPSRTASVSVVADADTQSTVG